MSDASLMPAAHLQQSGWRRLNWALYLFVLLGGLLASFPVPILSGFARVQTDDEDTVHLHYLLEHSWRWVSDPAYPATFWTPRYFHPATNTFAYSENLIGTAPIYWALRLGLSEDIALQVWILIAFAANYIAMLVVLRWLGVHPILATLGGYVFAFSLPRQAHLMHLLLHQQAFTPFAIYYFWKLMRQPDRRSWAMLLLLGAWQLFSGIQLGWFLAFALAAWLVIMAILDSSCIKRLLRFIKQRPVFVIITLAIIVVGVGLFFRHYFIGGPTLGVPYSVSRGYSPPISNWLAAEPNTLWADRLVLEKEHQQTMEHYLFAGLAFYIILVVAFAVGWETWRSGKFREVALLSLSTASCCLFLMAITFSFGSNLSLWYPIYSCVPGADGIRAIGRVVFLVIPIGLIGGLPAVQHLVEERVQSARARNAIYTCLLAICFIENVHFEHKSMERAMPRIRIDRYTAALSDADAAFLIQGPELALLTSEHETAAMWAGMNAGMPVINGYSSRYPDNYPEAPSGDPLIAVLRFLGDGWHGRLLLVDVEPSVKRRYYDVRGGVATPITVPE